VEAKSQTLAEEGLLTGKLVHLAIPVRWSVVAEQGRGPLEMACTYDIHPRGARLGGIREVSVGDMVMIERGRNKAMCQVVWTGDPSSQLRGQFTVQCVELGRTPWDDELQQMEEEYQPVILDPRLAQRAMRGTDNRRRRPRYMVEGTADVTSGVTRLAGEVQQLSEFGARIAAHEVLSPGTDFRMMLNVFDVSMALKAQVKYLTDNVRMGVEFQEIRRGDRPLLEYVLKRLRQRKTAEVTPVEVVVEGPLAVAI
jgi:hypothetical protein